MQLFKSLVIAASLIGSLAVAPMTFAEQSAQGNRAAATQQVTKQQAANTISKVNINTADSAVLAERLNGIGEKKAQAIVEHREKNGPFKTIDDLKNVSGIGEATLEKNRELLSVE